MADRKSGDIALREWARLSHDRGPTWSSSCTIYRAIYGGGRGHDAGLPDHVQVVDLAVVRLAPIIRSVIRCYYQQRETPWRVHAKQMGISRRDFENKLHIGQQFIANSI